MRLRRVSTKLVCFYIKGRSRLAEGDKTFGRLLLLKLTYDVSGGTSFRWNGILYLLQRLVLN